MILDFGITQKKHQIMLKNKEFPITTFELNIPNLENMMVKIVPFLTFQGFVQIHSWLVSVFFQRGSPLQLLGCYFSGKFIKLPHFSCCRIRQYSGDVTTDGKATNKMSKNTQESMAVLILWGLIQTQFVP